MFWVVSHHSVAARYSLHKRVSKIIECTSVSLSICFFIFRNEHAQSTSLGPRLLFCVVSHHSVAARYSLHKRVSKCIESTSLCLLNRFFVFSIEHAQSTRFGPRLMFWVVSHHSVAARYSLHKRASKCIECTSLCL